MRFRTFAREWKRRREYVPELGERHVLCNWLGELDDPNAPLVDMQRYSELLTLLPDRVVENLEKARLSRDGRYPMIKAGLGYSECLSSIIVDGSAIASSSTEAFLAPANLLPANYLQPGGIPGRTLRVKAQGRVTTLTTAATMTFKWGAALTNVIPTTTWAVSGGITQDTVVQTATMWDVKAQVAVRSVGSAGTVFAMGESEMATSALTIANATASYMGSAGSATPATATCDMTVPQFLGLTAKWSLTTAYSIQAHQLILEALN